jgi:E3 ubiquitin-protein ligase RNF115/126
MADSTRIPGERVKCHVCSNVWPREQGGLECPRCESEFVEIVSSSFPACPTWNLFAAGQLITDMFSIRQISDSTPPSPNLPPLVSRSDSLDDMRLTRSRSLDSLDRHSPWRDIPDPDEDDIGGFQFGGEGIPPRGYHWESRSPNGSSSFSFSMYSSNGGPTRITTNRRHGGGESGDPALREVQHDFEDLVQTIMGVTPQRTPQGRGMMPGSPPLPGFPFGPTRQDRQVEAAGPFAG